MFPSVVVHSPILVGQPRDQEKLIVQLTDLESISLQMCEAHGKAFLPLGAGGETAKRSVQKITRIFQK